MPCNGLQSQRSDSLLESFNRDSLRAQRFQILITLLYMMTYGSKVKYDVSLKVEEAFHITR